MDVKQLYTFVNSATKEAIGETAVVAEDFANIVDVGTAIFNANAVDKYVGTLMNRIGKEIFVNRVYHGSAPSVLMDGWMYGSVVEKISCKLPEAVENADWTLTDGTSYDVNVFHQPKDIQVKFFNSKTTFEIDMSFTELQIRQSFTNAQALNAFVSMLYTSIENSATIKMDELIRRTITNMIGETISDDYGAEGLGSKSGTKAINLLYLYNQINGYATPLTADKALSDPEFIRYACYVIKLANDHMSSMSTLFNVGNQPRFSDPAHRHMVMLADFANAADIYLQSDTFHNEMTKLPNAETVPYWQGQGTDYGFDSVSKIDVKTSTGKDVATTGILGVLFDRWALGVYNPDRRVTTSYNAKAEFYTNYYKYDATYFNDLNENMIVFFIA